MKCAQADKMLMALAAGALSPEASARLKEHLGGCAACSAELSQLKSAGDLFAAAAPPAAQAPSDLWEKVQAQISQPPARTWLQTGWAMRLATAGAAAAMVVLAYQVTLQDPQETLVPASDPTKQQAQLTQVLPKPSAEPVRRAAVAKAPAAPTFAPAPSRKITTAPPTAKKKVAIKRRALPEPLASVGFGLTFDRRDDTTATASRASGGNSAASTKTFFARSAPDTSAAASNLGVAQPEPAAESSWEKAREVGDTAVAAGVMMGRIAVDRGTLGAYALSADDTLELADKPLMEGDTREMNSWRTSSTWDGKAARTTRGYEENACAVEMVYTSPDERARTLFSY